MTVFFVGDKPSKKNLDPNTPFVGTKSYKTLLNWIGDLDVNVTDVVLANKKHISKHMSGAIEVELPSLYTVMEVGDPVIALGESAGKYLDKLKIHHFKMPHPSGLNRKLNDKKWLKKQLNKCREYIHE